MSKTKLYKGNKLFPPDLSNLRYYSVPQFFFIFLRIPKVIEVANNTFLFSYALNNASLKGIVTIFLT